MDLRIEPSPVITTGRDLAKMADDAKVRIESLFGSSDTAVQGNTGWKSSASLAACRKAWDGRLDQLVDQTKQAGQDLVDSAGRVAAADAEAADRLNNVLDGMAS
ncbi:MAG: hypothetical protein ACRDSR_26670 [Pseudonocardiaceae bacterium]